MSSLRFVSAVVVCASGAVAQTAPAPSRAIGEVASIDATARTLELKPDSGSPVRVAFDDKTVFLRVPPGETNLQKASRITLSDIQSGDRVLARGRSSENEGPMQASSIIVMTRAEIAQKHERDREEWQKRGASGSVTAVDIPNRRLTLSSRGPSGTEPLTVEWSDKTAFRRYAPDSIRFSEARPGTPGDIKSGDQVRVLGDREPNGPLRAEQIVSGAFRQAAGKVTAVDAAAGEFRITDLASKKPLTVKVNADTTLKNLPPETAAMMGRRMNAAVPARGSAPYLSNAMEKLPAFALSDLKPGDAVIVASTVGAQPGRVTAITVVSGAEPLLTAAPERATSFGGWNFGEIGLPQ